MREPAAILLIVAAAGAANAHAATKAWGASLGWRSVDQGRLELGLQADITTWLAAMGQAGLGYDQDGPFGVASAGGLLKADLLSFVPEVGAALGLKVDGSAMTRREEVWLGCRWYWDLDWAVGLTAGAEHSGGLWHVITRVSLWRVFF